MWLRLDLIIALGLVNKAKADADADANANDHANANTKAAGVCLHGSVLDQGREMIRVVISQVSGGSMVS